MAWEMRVGPSDGAAAKNQVAASRRGYSHHRAQVAAEPPELLRKQKAEGSRQAGPRPTAQFSLFLSRRR